MPSHEGVQTAKLNPREPNAESAPAQVAKPVTGSDGVKTHLAGDVDWQTTTDREAPPKQRKQQSGGGKPNSGAGSGNGGGGGGFFAAIGDKSQKRPDTFNIPVSASMGGGNTAGASIQV